MLRDLLKAKDGLAWLHDSLQEIEAVRPCIEKRARIQLEAGQPTCSLA